jgi:hypothetical protein
VFYLRECNILIQDQSQNLSQVRQKLQQGWKVSFPLIQQLSDLTQNDPGNDQGQGLLEQLAKIPQPVLQLAKQ